MYQLNIQTKEKVWKDEAGNSLPVNRIKPSEKLFEKITGKLATSAIKVSEQLAKFKEQLMSDVEEAFEAFLKETKGDREKLKGNVTFYNFDRTIKIERRIQEPIQFDDLTIMAAKAKLEEFLADGFTAKDEAVKEMILNAFNTSRGKLDVKKILALKRYSDRISDARYSEAMTLIDQAIRRPQSATYFHVWIRNEQGSYDAIPLALTDV